MRAAKEIILGTALWGWSIEKESAFALLDEFCGYGYSLVDTATNYPIDKNSNNYGLALTWIAEWANLNPNYKLRIILKIGSVDNSGSSSFNLSNERIKKIVESKQSLFSNPFYIISTHWDNRNEKESPLILDTISAFVDLFNQGYKVGLSGIRNPNLYFSLMPEFAPNWHIQVKENLFTNDARNSYQIFFKSNQYYAYGINGGGIDLSSKRELVSSKIRGIKIDEEKILNIYQWFRDKFPEFEFMNFNQIALFFNLINPYLNGTIIGPRSVAQLVHSIEYVQKLERSKKFPDQNEYLEIRKFYDDK